MIKFSKKYFLIYLTTLLILFILVALAFFEKQFKAKHHYSFFFGKQPLISVVVTSYNYERYLAQTLDSILAQTYKKYEVIIVDDGSTDNSVELIKKYTEKYSNFHLYQHENGINKGLPATTKFGVEKAKGEYIAFLESDDYWHENKLEEIVKMLNEYPDAVIVANNITPFGDDTESVRWAQIYPLNYNLRLKEVNHFDLSADLFSVIPTLSAVVIKKDVLMLCNFDTPIPAFLDVWLYKQIFVKYPLYYTKQHLTFWRRHAGSLNNSFTEKHSQNTDTFVKKLSELINKQNL